MTDTDERKGLPSASSMHRIAACPGSWNAERGIPDPGGADAAKGTELHAVLAGEESGDDLDRHDESVVDRCRELEAGLVAQLGFDGGDVEIRTEERAWYEDPNGAPVFSGRPDRVYSRPGGDSLTVDYKTMYGDIPPADENWQMRTLAVLTPPTSGETYVALIQPRAPGEPVTLAQYSFEDLMRAEDLILRAITAAEDPYAPRITGKHCDYCRARDRCPEARDAALALVNVSVPALTGEQFAEWIPRAQAAKKTIEAMLKAAKAFIDGGGVIPGYELKPGNLERAIVDPQAAYAGLADIVTAEEFAAVCGVPIGGLETLYAEKSGLKGAALKNALNERLGAALGSKQKAASLTRSKSPASNADTSNAGQLAL